jgi:proton glutamate symport protein
MALRSSSASWVQTLAEWLRQIGEVWIAVLQVVVVPLVITQALAAVSNPGPLGALGVRAVALFVLMLAAAATLTLLVAPLLLGLYRIDAATLASLRAGISVPDAVREGAGRAVALSDWLRGYIPSSVGRQVQGANLLPVLLGAILLGLAARRLPEPLRADVRNATQRLASVTMRVVGWVLRITPIGVMAIAFGLARGAGGSAVGLMTVFILLVTGLLLGSAALLYPLTSLLAGISIRRFAWGVAPAQLVALGTRSSLAALPALVEGGRDRLELPPAATGFVLPLAVSTFKFSMAISHPFMLLFLAHVFGVPLGPDRVLVFVGSILLFSFSVPGIPGGSPGLSTLPLFVAAGVPLEGVLILDAVDAVPDMAKTVTNVTADMSTAAIVTRQFTARDRRATPGTPSLPVPPPTV